MSETQQFFTLLVTILALLPTLITVIVTQNRNLRADFNKRVDELRDDHNHLSARLDSLNSKVDAIVVQINTRLDTLNGRVDTLTNQSNGRFDTLSTKVDNLHTKVEKLTWLQPQS